MLKPLITGETISIDNHNRGIGMDIDDRSIHLHKRFNKGNKRFDGAEVTVKLNQDEPSFNVETKNGARANSIIKEIKKAFKDDKLRRSFVSDLIDQLNELAAYATNPDYFTIDKDLNDRKLTQAGAEKIREIIERVYRYFGGPNDELKSLQYDPAIGVLAKFVTKPKARTRNNLSRCNLQLYNYPTCRPKSYYVKADLRNISFSLSSSRAELT